METVLCKQREPITLKESERCLEGQTEAGDIETLQVAMLASADRHPESRKPLHPPLPSHITHLH